jgi:23S rRNA (guanosine2251-2'-O)-methyltransferase
VPDPDLLGPEEELIAGRRPVEEAFVANRRAHRLLVVPQRRQALERLVLHATSLRIPIVEVEGGTLTALAGFDGHQGVAAVVDPRRYATLDEILARAIELDEPPFVLALDSLEDPQNLGTLLRSAEAAGVHGVIFPTHRQAPLTPAAVKASAGAVEHLLLAPVDDLAGALADLHARGLRIAGAEAEAPMTARQSDLRGPLVIVVGSEGQGLGPAIRRRTDLLMRIPMRGAIDSLNAAVAGSILLFEAVAQRDPGGSTDAARRARVFAGRSVPGSGSPAAAGAPSADAGHADPQAAAASSEPAAADAPEPKAASEPRARKARALVAPHAEPAAADAPEPKAASKPRAHKAPASVAPPTEPPEAAAPASEPAPADASAPRPKRASTRRVSAKAPAEPATPDAPATAPEAVPDADAVDELLPGGPPPEAEPAPAKPPRSRRKTPLA